MPILSELDYGTTRVLHAHRLYRLYWLSPRLLLPEDEQYPPPTQPHHPLENSTFSTTGKVNNQLHPTSS